MSETPRRDLAGRPLVAASVAPSSRPTDSTGAAPLASSAAPSAAVPSTPSPVHGSPNALPPASSPPYRGVAVLNDAGGDQGIDGPAYADLRQLLFQDNGTSARVTVTMAAPLPLHPASRESLGIGVDLYARTTQTEGDYQLFAEGGPDGWFAYLETPRGFVRYPGMFALSGSRLVFTVPWSSLGSRTSGAFSAFADWTQGGKAGTLGGNASSRDDAPALGSMAWSR